MVAIDYFHLFEYEEQEFFLDLCPQGPINASLVSTINLKIEGIPAKSRIEDCKFEQFTNWTDIKLRSDLRRGVDYELVDFKKWKSLNEKYPQIFYPEIPLFLNNEVLGQLIKDSLIKI